MINKLYKTRESRSEVQTIKGQQKNGGTEG